jgi:hypothetical protein
LLQILEDLKERKYREEKGYNTTKINATTKDNRNCANSSKNSNLNMQ